MAAVSIRHLGIDKPSAARKAAGPNRILGDVSLDIVDGEFLVLVGPSGCGKTTLLRCVAGLEELTRGEIFIDGQRVNDLAPRDRDIAMVFQSYALYPHMTVFDNLAFGLRMRKTSTTEISRLVDEAAQMLEIHHLLQRYPRELSGGQRQRVAMGRAVVRRPKVFLFDEPLSNLDAALRQQMRLELLRLHRRLQSTMVYVTHDQVEAMTLADRIAVLRQGALEQIGTPQELYLKPKNVFVAKFFGAPEMNMLPGRITAGQFVREGAELPLQLPVPGLPDGKAVLGIRAEDLHLMTAESSGQLSAQVDVIEHLGAEDLVHVRSGASSLVARCAVQQTPATGAQVQLRLEVERCHFFSCEAGPTEGHRLEPTV